MAASCCQSGSLIGLVCDLGGGPGRTGWASHVPMGATLGAFSMFFISISSWWIQRSGGRRSFWAALPLTGTGTRSLPTQDESGSAKDGLGITLKLSSVARQPFKSQQRKILRCAYFFAFIETDTEKIQLDGEMRRKEKTKSGKRKT